MILIIKSQRIKNISLSVSISRYTIVPHIVSGSSRFNILFQLHDIFIRRNDFDFTPICIINKSRFNSYKSSSNFLFLSSVVETWARFS